MYENAKVMGTLPTYRTHFSSYSPGSQLGCRIQSLLSAVPAPRSQYRIQADGKSEIDASAMFTVLRKGFARIGAARTDTACVAQVHRRFCKKVPYRRVLSVLFGTSAGHELVTVPVQASDSACFLPVVVFALLTVLLKLGSLFVCSCQKFLGALLNPSALPWRMAGELSHDLSAFAGT